MESPLGKIILGQSDKGLVFLEFANSQNPLCDIERWLRKYDIYPQWIEEKQKLKRIIQQLEEYLAGNRTNFDVSLDLIGTPFQRKVWKALTTIPYGKTCSYGEIANQIGNPKAVRAVGGANNKNPISIVVPCHRVIGTNGALVGYGGGLDKKEYLLKLEGFLP